MSQVRSGLEWLAGEQTRRGVELFVLAGLVVTQPLLEAIGKAPDFLVLHRLGRLDIALLVAAITFLPALGLWAVGLAATLADERARRSQLGMVGALGTLLGWRSAGKLCRCGEGRWC